MNGHKDLGLESLYFLRLLQLFFGTHFWLLNPKLSCLAGSTLALQELFIDLLRLQQCSYTRHEHLICNKQKPSYDCWNSPSSQARCNVENASLGYILSTITRTHVPDAFWCSDVEWKEQHSTARTAAPNSLDFKSWINDYWRSSGIQNIYHWVDERDQYYKQQYNNNDQ